MTGAVGDSEAAGAPGQGDDERRLRRRAKKAESQAEDRAQQAWGRVTERIDSRPLTARVYATVQDVIAKQSGYRLSLSAAGSAFWLVIALFPATIAVIMLFGLVVDPASLANDVQNMTARSPNSLGAALAGQAQKVAAAESGTLSIGLVVSLVVTLWSVSSGMYALTRAVRQAYGLGPLHYFVARWRAFLGACVAVIVLGVFVAVGSAYGAWHAGASSTEKAVSYIVGLPFAAVVIAVNLVVLFRFSVALRIPWRNVALGAVLGSLVTVALIVGVALFGSYLAHYQQIYGTLTGMVVTMIGVYTLMYAILLCAVFNAEWHPLDPGLQAAAD